MKLESMINNLLIERTDLIPSLFEITKKFILKHNEVFNEILNLRKIEFSLNDNNQVGFIEKLKNERLIHHEMNFIYNICLKNKKLEKVAQFQYIKDLTINRSYLIGEKVEKYRSILKILNRFISIKNYTIIGLFFPIKQKIEI